MASATVYQLRAFTVERTSAIRCHHLLKTFWTGAGGWNDVQLPDGTAIWTSPSGTRYETKPGGALFFPQLSTPTGDIKLGQIGGPVSDDRGAMMPRRRRTRAQDKAHRIAAERQHNTARNDRRQHVFEELLALRLARNNDPPPF